MSDRVAWAFGLGLERLAMIMFDIPDIRLFWTQDERFLEQFKDGKRRFDAGDAPRFKPYSKFPATTKDVSFWLPSSAFLEEKGLPPFSDNDVYSIIRETAGEDVENVKLIDRFVHPKTKRESRAYRVVYRSFSRTLTNEEVNKWHDGVREELKKLGVELR